MQTPAVVEIDPVGNHAASVLQVFQLLLARLPDVIIGILAVPT